MGNCCCPISENKYAETIIEDQEHNQIQKLKLEEEDNLMKNLMQEEEDKIEPIQQIGQGAFGKVFLSEKRTNQKEYAIKIIAKNKIDSLNKYKHAIEERKILENSNHQYLVNLRYAFQSPSNLYLVMDYVSGGELFVHLKRTGPFSEQKSKFYIAEIILAIEYLQQKNIIYRDLKPENVLLDGDGHVKITDFGLAKQLTEENNQTFTVCGTPEYLAPEVLLKGGYDKSVDFWTIGIFLYELLTLRTPFRAPDRKQIFNNILNKEVPMKPFFSTDAKSLLLQLLKTNPKERLGVNGIQELKNHPFFNSLDWKKLENRQEIPPWKPTTKSQQPQTSYVNASLSTDTINNNNNVKEKNDLMFDNFTMDASSRHRKVNTSQLTGERSRLGNSQIKQGQQGQNCSNPASSKIAKHQKQQSNSMVGQNKISQDQDDVILAKSIQVSIDEKCSQPPNSFQNQDNFENQVLKE